MNKWGKAYLGSMIAEWEWDPEVEAWLVTVSTAIAGDGEKITGKEIMPLVMEELTELVDSLG